VGRLPVAEQVYREAVDTCEKLAKESPGVPAYRVSLAEALFGLGGTLSRSGKFPAADEAYTRALELREELLHAEPKNPAYRAEVNSTCYNLALLLVWEQDPPFRGANRALNLSKRAVQLDPQAGSRWQILGLAQFRVGNWQECLNAFKSATELKSENALTHFFQAMAYWHLGQKDEARRHYDAAADRLGQNASPDGKALRLRDEAAALLGITAAEKRK